MVEIMVFGSEINSMSIPYNHIGYILTHIFRFTVRNITFNNAATAIFGLWNWGTQFITKPWLAD